jgi:two-component system, cell cycle sensor histidine kinase and response regulator CckA
VASQQNKRLVQAIWFVAAAFLAGGGALIGHRLLTAEREETVATHLSFLQATAELKGEAIRHWQAERSTDFRLLALSPRVARRVQALLRGDVSGDHQRKLQAELDLLRRGQADCVALAVFDSMGTTLAASYAQPGEPPAHLAPPGNAPPPSSTFRGDPVAGLVRLIVAAPIVDEVNGTEQTHGQLLAVVEPRVHLFPLLQAGLKAWPSGELGLAERWGDEVVVLTVVRNRPGASEIVRLPLTRVAAPAVQAVNGATGLIEGIDHRGVPVLAVARPVAGTDFVLIVKEDLDEVLGGFRERMRLYAMALAGLLLSGIGLLAFMQQLRRVRAAGREGARLAAELEERSLLNLELTRSALRFRSLVLATAQIVWTTNADGEVVEEQPTWQGYTGMTWEETRGFGWRAAIHPEDVARIGKARRRAIATGTVLRTSLRIRRADGQYGVFEVQGVPVADPDEQVAEWIGTCTDVSQRLQAEEALRASELWQRRLVESLSVGIVVHAADTRIIMSNPEASRILGLTPDQLRGRTAVDPAWRFVREDGTPLAQVDFPVNRVLATRQAIGAHVFGIDRGDGSPPSWVLANAYPTFDEHGQLEQIVVSFGDISDQRRAEAQAARLAENLRVSQKIEALGRLAGGVAHDFNNLLSVILGHTAFALEAVGEADPVRGDLLEVEKAGRRAAALTSQLLAFGRRQVLQPLALDLNHVVVELEKMLRRLIGEDIRLEKSLVSGLWLTLADPAQVEQVIMNLVINARDAMPNGGLLTISTANFEQGAGAGGPLPAGDYVVLTVTDSGSGIDEATRARLFEPFFTTKPQGKGTGLGLATVYGIVSQSGGQVQVESEPGHGSTFRVLLPRAAKVEAPAPRPAPVALGAVARGGETILVVEDEGAVRDVTRRILEAAGYRVLAAGSGEEALRVCREHTGELHLLLSDVVMPNMGGPECGAAAQRLRPGLRVLFMSGYAEEAIANQGVLQPGIPLLGKPFAAAELTRLVRAVLDDPAPPPIAPPVPEAGAS